MSSSIEPDFNPPDNLTRDEVIAMAKQYINYWKIEAHSYGSKYWSLMEQIDKKKKKNKKKKHGKRNP
jgi:hypothetical protein